MIPLPEDAPPWPALVRRIAGDRPVREVWRNVLGGRTFRIGAEPGDQSFLKLSPPHPEVDLAGEAERLAWAAPWARVPAVLGVGVDDSLQWLHTAGLPGRTGVDPYWIGRPRAAARRLGRALREWHDVVPVAGCPWTWSVEQRVAALPAGVGPEDRDRLLAHAPPTAPRDVVVCTGDACAPNVLLDGDSDGHAGPSGYLDLGSLGVASRWADVGTALWSLEHNYGRGREEELLRGYGLVPPEGVVDWYRNLWTAGD